MEISRIVCFFHFYTGISDSPRMDPPELAAEEKLANLCSFGFSGGQATISLEKNQGSLENALYELFSKSFPSIFLNPTENQETPISAELLESRNEEITMLQQILETRFQVISENHYAVTFQIENQNKSISGSLDIRFPSNCSYPLTLPFIAFRSRQIASIDSSLLLDINRELLFELLLHVGSSLLFRIQIWFEETLIPKISQKIKATKIQTISFTENTSQIEKRKTPPQIKKNTTKIEKKDEKKENIILFSIQEKKEFIDSFTKDGFVVVPIFTEPEIEIIRKKFHETLGIDHEKALAGDPETLEKLGIFFKLFLFLFFRVFL